MTGMKDANEPTDSQKLDMIGDRLRLLGDQLAPVARAQQIGAAPEPVLTISQKLDFLNGQMAGLEQLVVNMSRYVYVVPAASPGLQVVGQMPMVEKVGRLIGLVSVQTPAQVQGAQGRLEVQAIMFGDDGVMSAVSVGAIKPVLVFGQSGQPSSPG